MPPRAPKVKAAAKTNAKNGSATAVSKKAQKKAPRRQKQKKATEQPAEAPPAEVPAKAPGKRSRTLHIRPARSGGHCVLLSHLPAGLREPQLRRFLGQFGRVSRIRVPRASAGAGNTKGVAFVEMADPAAARVVAETLDNYLMFTRLVRCKVVQDPKRLTFAPDGRRRKPQVAKAAADAATSAAASARVRSRRLRAKVERLKQLDPEFEFELQSS